MIHLWNERSSHSGIPSTSSLYVVASASFRLPSGLHARCSSVTFGTLTQPPSSSPARASIAVMVEAHLAACASTIGSLSFCIGIGSFLVAGQELSNQFVMPLR